MGRSQNNSGHSSDLKLDTVATESLRDKLNRIYDIMRTQPRTLSSSGLFEYLWELKEAALMEGRTFVQVPSTWLEELEQDFSELESDGIRGH